MKKDIENKLIGNQFYSLNEGGKIHWQGKIIDEPKTGFYLVQLFSWLDGSPTIRKIIKFEDMTNWLFYPDFESAELDYICGTASRLKYDPKAK